jgi:ABC-type nickel/cobalt efflux system permease component RcnA
MRFLFMKKSLFLGLVATALMFTACKKEEAAHDHHDHEAMTHEHEGHEHHDATAEGPAPEATPCDKAVSADGSEAFSLQGEGTNTGCTLSE